MRVRVSLLTAAMICAAPQLAFADDLSDAATKVTECRSISDDAARLACLDAAALAVSLALNTGSSTASTAPVVTAPAPPSEPEWARAPEPKQAPVQQAATEAPQPKAEQENVPIWARVFRSDEPKEKADNVYAVTITRITRNNAGRHFFHTSEGQVWRQTVADKVRAPKSLPVDAVIQQKVLGSPALSFADDTPGSYTVRRVE